MKTKVFYRVKVWHAGEGDGDPGRWAIACNKCGKWALRRVLRRLYSLAYDRDASILVERHDEMKRWRAAMIASGNGRYLKR